MAFSINLEEFKDEIMKAAKKGALKEIQEFYTGYDSPYRKKVKESLEKIKIDGCISLPNILDEIQKSLEGDILCIAQNSIAYTGVADLNKYLRLESKNIEFDDILKEFVETNFNEFSDNYTREDFKVTIEKSERFDWLDVFLEDGDNNGYEFTLHHRKSKNKEGNEIVHYELLSLHQLTGEFSSTRNDNQIFSFTDPKGNTFKFPSQKSLMNDKFSVYLMSLVIGGSKITFNGNPKFSSFDDIEFPGDHCAC